MNRWVDTICLRCGYPLKSVPEHYYNKMKTCKMCRTVEEEELHKKRVEEFLKRYK